ncbi:hypothetical protein [Miltoncostaea oceani]|uniref:hypothetical protein n=1 Tax=Miltoncostaea oceani TaxID=2843216 RepID=UPI001C3C78D0|nr:hypothetical protein [Miltoncostaea oceani]
MPPALAGAIALVAPGVAVADIPVAVPERFLGGPIAAAVPVAAVAPDGRPSPSPVAVGDACMGEKPSDCADWGAEAQVDLRGELPGLAPPPAEGTDPAPIAPVEDPATGDPEPAVDLTPVPVVPIDEDPAARPPAVAAAPPAPGEVAAAFGRLLSPGAASWLPWQTPTLRWRATRGAGHYNVQVFRGTRRVLNAWPTGNRLRVPEGVLRQGRTYVWVVWPGVGPRSARRYGPPIGRSTFELTLRPRIVLRPAGPGRTGVVAEVRPHIPFATIALGVPRSLVGRVPDRVTLTARGRFTLPVAKRAGERLSAWLVTRGPTPPLGLRG